MQKRHCKRHNRLSASSYFRTPIREVDLEHCSQIVTIAFRLLHTFGQRSRQNGTDTYSCWSQSPFGFFILSDCGYSIMFIIKKQGGGFGGSINFLMEIHRYRNKKWPENIRNALSFMMFCSFGGSVRGVLDFESRRKEGKREDGKTENGRFWGGEKGRRENGKRKTEDGRFGGGEKGRRENGKRKIWGKGKGKTGKRKTEEGRAKLFFFEFI